MKKITFYLLVIGFVFCSNAQKRSGFGLHAGTNASGVYNITNGYLDAYDPVAGYQVGLRYNLKLGPVGLCSEVNWNVINYFYPPVYLANLNPWGTDIYFTGGEANLNYVSIPLLLKLYIGGFNLHVGAQSSYLMSGTDALGGDITSDTPGVNDIDVAAVVGLGLDMKNGLYFAWRSTASITTIDDADYLPSVGVIMLEDDLPRLVSSSFAVGYNF